MEQNTFKADKKAKWSVLIIVETEGFTGRIFTRKKNTKRLRLPNELVKSRHEYMYLSVTKMYKKGNVLHIHIGKAEHHMHDISRVVSIQVREYKRSGIQ